MKGYKIGAVGLLLGVFVAISSVHAQDDVRASVAGEQSAESTHVSPDGQPYNLSIGPVSLRTDAGVTGSYNDNINLADTNKVGDFIVSTNLNVHAFWQVTEDNDLSLDLGLGYERYLEHPNYSSGSVLLSPNSALQFNLYVEDFKINFHDQFSYQQDPTQQGDLSNVAQFRRFVNDAGINVDWDLGDATLSLDYDHFNLWVFDSEYAYLDSAVDSFQPKASFQFSKTVTAGVEANFSKTTFDQNIQNNNEGVTVGPFVQARISENLAINGAVGWDRTVYNSGGLNGDTESIDSYYWNAGITHRLNNVFSQSLTVGREFDPGFTTNYTQRTYANYVPSFKVLDAFDLSPMLWWENLDDSDGTYRQKTNRYGASLNLGYLINSHLSVQGGYSYILKVANPSDLNYQQNVYSLGLKYSF